MSNTIAQAAGKQPNRIAGLLQLFLEKEAELQHLYVEIRAALIEADEEARRMRAEARRFNLEIFTEIEAAKKFKVSQDTFARWRAEKGLPHLRQGMIVRYTSEQLVRITEILERGDNTGRGKGRGQPSKLNS